MSHAAPEVNTMPDCELDLELAAIETRRGQLREQRARRAAELRDRLAALQQRLRALSREVTSPDPNKVDAATQAAHQRQGAVYLASFLFDTGLSGFWCKRRSFEEHVAEADRLRAEQRRTLNEYMAAYGLASRRLYAETDAANKRNAIAAAEVREQIAAIEGELLRLTSHESS